MLGFPAHYQKRVSRIALHTFKVPQFIVSDERVRHVIDKLVVVLEIERFEDITDETIAEVGGVIVSA